MRSLSKSWEVKVTSIQEAKKLNTLPLEELLGSLISYELTQMQHAQYDEEKKRRTIAFKSTNEEEEKSATDEDNEEIAFITQKFK